MFAQELPSCSGEEIALRLWRRPGFFWLDGECAGHPEGHWSFFGCQPVERRWATLRDGEPLAALPRTTAAVDEPSPLAGAPLPAEVPRWVGYLAYDARLCGRPQRLERPQQRPVAHFGCYTAVLALCHRDHRVFAVGDDAASVHALVQRLRGQPLSSAGACLGPLVVPPRERHRAALLRAFEHIAAGDLYQVNLARRFSAPLSGDPFALWLALRRAGPVPLGCYLADGHGPERALLSRSMERFLRFDAATRQLVTRPIKGTLARGGDDRAEAQALQSDPKERAEHAMIVDLMRNDLGRVAEIGSVQVEAVMQVERYAHLSHLVSSVRCRVREGLGLDDILAASFPPGSVTGAPKSSAVNLIEQLEDAPRDVYTGAVGFVDRLGGLSLSVAIRTALAERGIVHYWAGGGIVEASEVEREIAETELKARVFAEAARSLASEFSLFPAPVLR